jgi:membrane-associated protease RseP (regulator of RpoE activity)
MISGARRFGFVPLLAGLLLGASAAPAPREPNVAPSPEMKRLEFMVGRWQLHRTFSRPDRTPPEPAGSIEVAWIAGGQFLRSQEQWRPSTGGPPYDVLTVFGYDPWAKRYRMWTFLPRSEIPMEWSGRFEGQRLVMMLDEYRSAPGGIGVRTQRTPEGQLRVTSCLAGSPAALAGVKEGDIILKVDGKTLAELNERDARNLLWGDVGSSVRVTLRSGDAEREVTLTRRSMAIQRRLTYTPRDGNGYDSVTEEMEGDRFVKLIEVTHGPAQQER